VLGFVTMNIKETHKKEAPISAQSIFKGKGNAVAIQILKGETLKEHSTKVPAFLICIEGEVVFENKLGVKQGLKSGDMLAIEPNVKHWLEALVDSQLLLLK